MTKTLDEIAGSLEQIAQDHVAMIQRDINLELRREIDAARALTYLREVDRAQAAAAESATLFAMEVTPMPMEMPRTLLLERDMNRDPNGKPRGVG